MEREADLVFLWRKKNIKQIKGEGCSWNFGQGKCKVAICSRYNVTHLPRDEPRCYVECNCNFVIEAGENKKQRRKRKIHSVKYHINLNTLLWVKIRTVSRNSHLAVVQWMQLPEFHCIFFQDDCDTIHPSLHRCYYFCLFLPANFSMWWVPYTGISTGLLHCIFYFFHQLLF